jgi:HK97 family phage portal protein
MKLMNDQFQTDAVDKKYIWEEQINAPELKSDLALVYKTHVWNCVAINAKASSISSVPVRLYPKGSDTEILSGSLWDLIHLPNEDQTWEDFIEAFVCFSEMIGDGFIEVNDANFPTAMKVLRSYWVDITLDRTNKYVYNYKPVGAADIVFKPGIVKHMKFFSGTSDIYGQSAMSSVLDDVIIDKNSTKFTKDFFAKAGMINLYLAVKAKTDGSAMQPFEFDRLKKEIATNWQGIKNANTIPILENGELKSAGFDVDQVLMDKVNTSVRDKVLTAHGVPPIAVMLFADATYNNAATQWKAYWSQTITPRCKKLQNFFNRSIFYKLGYEIEFDLSDIAALKDDEQVKSTTAVNLKQIMTLNEVRDYLYQKPPVEGGDALPVSAPQPVQMMLHAAEPIKKSLRKVITLELIKAAKDGHKKDFEQAVAKYEGRLIPFFQKWKDDVLEVTVQKGALETAIGHLPKKSKELMKELATVSDEVAQDIMNSNYDRMTGGREMTDAVRTPIVDKLQKHIADWSETSANSITDTMQESLTQAITENYQDVDALTKRVSEIFEGSDMSYPHAKMIARTEANTYSNVARIETAKELGLTKKTWLHAPGEHIGDRDWHVDLNGKSVGIDEPFIVKHGTNIVEMQFPGDPTGGPDNNCNCRCTTFESGAND